MKVHELIIIGAGPAGMAAAIYANRADIDFLIIEGGAPGGKLLNTHIIENYPGIAKSGPEVSLEFYQHLQNFKIQIIQDFVENISDVDNKIKKISTKNNQNYFTKTIIIATGMKPRKLGVSNYDKFYGRGISTCLICDGSFYRNKDIAVIGGGNSALEESLFAVKFIKNLHIVNISEKPSAFPMIVNNVSKHKNIIIHNNAKTLKILEKDDKISGLLIQDLEKDQKYEIPVSGIFTYIGWVSTVKFFSKTDTLKILNSNGYIETNNNLESKISGIFAAGDVLEKDYKQVTTAVSDGTVAALSVKKYLDNL